MWCNRFCFVVKYFNAKDSDKRGQGFNPKNSGNAKFCYVCVATEGHCIWVALGDRAGKRQPMIYEGELTNLLNG